MKMMLRHKATLISSSDWSYTIRALFQYGNPFKIKDIKPFEQWYLNLTKQFTMIGAWNQPQLKQQLRLFPTANVLEQKWIGEFRFPGKIYGIAPFSQSKISNPNYKKGFLILNVQLETIDGEQGMSPELRYVQAPLSNQWAIDGFAYSFRNNGNTFHSIDGDLAYFDMQQLVQAGLQTNVTN
jgi:hypothetical protein